MKFGDSLSHKRSGEVEHAYIPKLSPEQLLDPRNPQGYDQLRFGQRNLATNYSESSTSHDKSRQFLPFIQEQQNYMKNYLAEPENRISRGEMLLGSTPEQYGGPGGSPASKRDRDAYKYATRKMKEDKTYAYFARLRSKYARKKRPLTEKETADHQALKTTYNTLMCKWREQNPPKSRKKQSASGSPDEESRLSEQETEGESGQESADEESRLSEQETEGESGQESADEESSSSDDNPPISDKRKLSANSDYRSAEYQQRVNNYWSK